MGIGRREFLQIFGSSLAVLAATPSDAVGVLDDLYLNRKLGVSFRKPNGWSFVDVKTMGTIAEGTLLAIDDDLSSNQLLDLMGLPFVSVALSHHLSTPVSPCAHFILVDRCTEIEEIDALVHQLEDELDQFNGKRASRHPSTIRNLYDDIRSSSEMFKAFRVTSSPEEFQLSKCGAAQYTASLLYEHRELVKPAKIRQRTIYVENTNASYLIRLVDAPAENVAFDFSSFVNSIVFI